MANNADVWVDEAFRHDLESAGYVDFDDYMTTERGVRLRVLKDRENWRLDLPHASGPSRRLYLKRHRVRTWRSRWLAWRRRPPSRAAGKFEARNITRLSQAGIAAMRLAAFGERLRADGLLESFVLTEELTGFTQLDHFLRQRFPPRDEPLTTRRDPALDQLIDQVAEVAGRFHRAGFNHRDFYCCHFFIREESPGRYLVHLIDLQRVARRRWPRRRWIVKDLAQLAYSVPRDRVSATRQLAFMKRYLGVRKLRPADKRLIRRVLARLMWMENHLGAHP